MSRQLVAYQTATVTNAGTAAVEGVHRYDVMQFVLKLTAAATEAGDTLDVFVQTRIGGDWFDIVHFTQIIGTGADSQQHVAKVIASEPQAMYEIGTALAAGSVRHIMGDAYRARWTIVDVAVADNQSFTFEIEMEGKMDRHG